MQSIINKADLLAHYKTFYGNAEIANTIIDRYLNVSLDDIQISAQKYLNINNRVVLNYLPRKTGKLQNAF
jgi:predicted Zn-dependent peptidase